MTATEIVAVSMDDLFSEWLPAWARMAESCPRSAVFLDPVGISAIYKSSLVVPLNGYLALQDRQPAALAICSENDISVAGTTLSTLQSINVDKFGRYEFLCEKGHESSLETIWEYLLTSGRWQAIDFNLIPSQSPTFKVGSAVANRLRWHLHVEPQFSSPWKPLCSDTSDWDADLKSKFKSNLRNRERRIEKLGRLRFQVVTDINLLQKALDVFYQLECRSWKGNEKSAIIQKPLVKSFYDNLVLGGAGNARIAVLYLDDQPIAAQLLRVVGGRMFLVKVSYNPEFGKYSPGQLIMRRVVKYAIETGISELDFLGEEAAWKSDWNATPDQNLAMRQFSPGIRGTYGYVATHGIREAAKRIPGARRIVSAVRNSRRAS